MERKFSIQRYSQTGVVDSDAFEVSRKQAEYERKSNLVNQQSEKVHSAFKLVITYGISAVASLLVLVAFLTAMFGNLHLFLETSSAFMQMILKYFIPGSILLVVLYFLPKAVGGFFKLRYENKQLAYMQSEIDSMNAATERDNALANAEVERIKAEAAEIRARAVRLTSAFEMDGQGNLVVRNPETGGFTVLTGNMREFEHLSSYHNHVTGVTEEKSSNLLTSGNEKNIHIPSFAESMNAGLIGPGQDKVLICYELERDEETGEVTGEIKPYLDELENNCTNFLGGSSKSGKSTYMAHLSAQEALMNALFYVIDPHLSHPEKSIAVKIKPLAHAFIMPPAQTDQEVYAVLQHAQAEAEARLLGKETRYSGRPIVFIVDEVLNLFGRAQRNPDNADIQALYRDLALFMRDLGTQYNKYGVNGIFGSQYVTKDAFKLPKAGNVDFRDGCQSQTLLRLPANQAQAMRLLDKSDLRGVRKLAPGHGYMGFANGDIIRMASGNVALQDIEFAGRLVNPSPNSKQYQFGTSFKDGSNGSKSDVPHVVDADRNNTQKSHNLDRNTGDIENDITLDVEPTEQSTEPVPVVPARPNKEFTSDQALSFLRLYKQFKSIRRSLEEMHISYGDYQACASRLVREIKA